MLNMKKTPYNMEIVFKYYFEFELWIWSIKKSFLKLP